MSTKTVLRAIHRGRLRASRLGEHGAFRIREADVERWIESSVLDVPLAGARDGDARAAAGGAGWLVGSCSHPRWAGRRKGSVSALRLYER